MKQFKTTENVSGRTTGGIGGALLRGILFLALLIGGLFLLNLLAPDKKFGDQKVVNPDKPYVKPVKPDPKLDSLLGDTTWRRPVPDIPELPKPDSNYIRQPDPEEIIEDPYHRRIVSTCLNIILEKENEGTMVAFARKFKQVYPGAEYQITFADERTYMLQITLPARERERVKQEIQGRMPDFSFIVFEEEIWESQRVPSDPAFSDAKASWYFKPIQAYEAWDITQGSTDVTVAVLDDFFDMSHPEFRGKIVHPFNVVRESPDVRPPNGYPLISVLHGTHVAGLAVAQSGNGTGLCGIAPKCRLMPVGVFFDQPTQTPNGLQFLSSNSLVAYGILYAIYRGADVINLSVGTPSPLGKMSDEQQMNIIRRMPKDLEHVWDYIYHIADRRGVIIVTAAGNDKAIAGFDCSKRNNVTIRVSALDHNLKRASFSNYGYYNDGKNGAKDYSSLSAPGVDIFSSVPGGYFPIQGTSQASPIVAGAVALMKSLDRNITAREAIQILQETGRPVGGKCGPLIQIRDALKRVKGKVLRFDDIQKDSKAILGLWESTGGLVNTQTNAPIKKYFRFTSTSTGTIIIKDSGDGTTYTGPVSLHIGKEQVTFASTARPRCEDGSFFYPYRFTGRAGKNGEMECYGENIENKENNFTFRLRRVNE